MLKQTRYGYLCTQLNYCVLDWSSKVVSTGTPLLVNNYPAPIGANARPPKPKLGTRPLVSKPPMRDDLSGVFGGP